MGIRCILGNMIDGNRLVNLPIRTASWSDDLDTPEQIDCLVDLDNKVARSLDLGNTATTGKSFLAVIDTGIDGSQRSILAAGPLWGTAYNRNDSTLQLTAKGIGSLLDHRFILPPAAATANLADFTIPDPLDATKTIPNPALASAYTGVSLGTIVKRLIQQMMSWTGGTLPIILPADEADANVDHQRTYQAADFKTVWSAIEDIMGVIDGPEVKFDKRFNSTGLGVEWLLRVGTVAQPLIFSNTVTSWNVTVKDSPVSNLQIGNDATDLGSLSWATGGRQNDDVLVARAYDPTLLNAGYPLMELLDSSHTSVSIQSTLDSYAMGGLRLGKAPTENWSFDVKAHPTNPRTGLAAGPQLGDYSVGDFIRLNFSAYDPETGRGDIYRRERASVPLRIVGLSGDEIGETVTVKVASVVG